MGAVPGVGGVGARAGFPQGALTGRSGFSSQTDTATYTWSGVSIGSASPTRYVIVAAVGFSSGAIDGVTVGGIAAVKIAEQSFDRSFWMAKVPTGTTANIVMSLASGANVGMMSAWTFDNGNPDLQALSSGTASGAVDVLLPVGSACFAFNRRVGSPYSTTWTGMTANYSSGSVDTGYMGSAHVNGGASADATVTINSSNTPYLWVVVG